MRVAVIGSGLAGLTASWMLTRDAGDTDEQAQPATVELYESAPSLGMVTHKHPQAHDSLHGRPAPPPRHPPPMG